MSRTVLLAIFMACLLFIGHRWGIAAVQSQSANRDESPFLFGMVMAMEWLIFIGLLIAIALGN